MKEKTIKLTEQEIRDICWACYLAGKEDLAEEKTKEKIDTQLKKLF